MTPPSLQHQPIGDPCTRCGEPEERHPKPRPRRGRAFKLYPRHAPEGDPCTRTLRGYAGVPDRPCAAPAADHRPDYDAQRALRTISNYDPAKLWAALRAAEWCDVCGVELTERAAWMCVARRDSREVTSSLVQMRCSVCASSAVRGAWAFLALARSGLTGTGRARSLGYCALCD